MKPQEVPVDRPRGPLDPYPETGELAAQDVFPRPASPRGPRRSPTTGRPGRARGRGVRGGPAFVFATVGVVAGVGAGILGIGALVPDRVGALVPSLAGLADTGVSGAVGQDAPAAGAGADVAEMRAEENVSRSVRDPQLGTDGPGALPLALERAVEPGSGLMGTEVVHDLGGTLVVVPAEVPAPGAGPVKTVRIEVEEGLPVDAETFATAVMTTLNDPRGWGGVDGVTFARTGGEASFRIVLASPATTDALCAPLKTGGIYSCGVTGAAVLNFSRWVEGATDFAGDMELYRHYLVNHEVGHVLGHRHLSCPAPGALAPVMVQQSMSTEGCLPNGWPTLG